ncbi:hypothetical protein LPICM02_350044 [Pseudolactococcus piscium]|nr:hypothetical protein LPICM02_350044 [Lactococcus piscium]
MPIIKPISKMIKKIGMMIANIGPKSIDAAASGLPEILSAVSLNVELISFEYELVMRLLTTESTNGTINKSNFWKKLSFKAWRAAAFSSELVMSMYLLIQIK